MTKPATATLFISLALSTAAFAEGERKLDLVNDGAYEHVIAPILSKTCTGCHGADKNKGKIRLHTPEEITKAEVLVAGKPDESELISRILLPEDDEDVMPPEGKTQLTAEQKSLLNWWIAQGAAFDKKISELTVPDDIKLILAKTEVAPAGASPDANKADGPPQPVAAAAPAVKLIEETGVLIMPLAQNTTFLTANAINVAKEFNDGHVKGLVAVAPQLQWLDISKTQITDASAADLAKLQTLTRLHLENTAITDASLAGVGQLVNLEYLNLYGTKVTDAGIQALKGLKGLKKIFLWQTGVTDAGAADLISAIPGLDVNMGWKEPEKPAEEAPKEGDKPAEPKAEEAAK
jgi:hypothetical protein